MAQVQQTILIDDVDGSDASETLTFSLDGATYEIDLNPENAAALRESLSMYIGHGRRAGAGTRSTRSQAPKGSGDVAAVRAWAKENGHAVSERGRISTVVREAYEAARS